MIIQQQSKARIQETISGLIEDHKRILSELKVIEESISREPQRLRPEAIEVLRGLSQFTMEQHHRREEDELFTWMLEQGPDADKTILDRICLEHHQLEEMERNIAGQVEGLIANNFTFSPRALIYEINNFIDLYREHIELEEKFIYLIAKGILLKV